MVAFHIKALVVPWHQFVYTLFIPYGRLVIQPGHDNNPSGPHHLRRVYQQGATSLLETEKGPTVPGSDCTK